MNGSLSVNMAATKMHFRSIDIISRILGVLILYVAVFLYEDEEGTFQNKLEEWWIRVRYSRERAISTAAEISASSAQAASGIFDKVFGKRLFSFRALGVSICFSLASFYLFTPIVLMFRLKSTPQIAPADVRHTLWFGFLFLSFGVGRSIYDTKWSVRLWNASLIFILASNFGPIVFAIFTRMGIHAGTRFISFMAILLAMSFACDLLFLGLSRWMLRRTSRMAGLPQMGGFLILNLGVAIFLLVGPVELMVKVISDPHNVPLVGMAALVLIPLNSVDFALCLVVLFILAFFIGHRMLWPVIERPLYALARYGVFKHKELLWSIGLVLLAGPGQAKSLLLWVLEKLPAFKG